MNRPMNIHEFHLKIKLSSYWSKQRKVVWSSRTMSLWPTKLQNQICFWPSFLRMVPHLNICLPTYKNDASPSPFSFSSTSKSRRRCRRKRGARGKGKVTKCKRVMRHKCTIYNLILQMVFLFVKEQLDHSNRRWS